MEASIHSDFAPLLLKSELHRTSVWKESDCIYENIDAILEKIRSNTLESSQKVIHEINKLHSFSALNNHIESFYKKLPDKHKVYTSFESQYNCSDFTIFLLKSLQGISKNKKFFPKMMRSIKKRMRRIFRG